MLVEDEEPSTLTAAEEKGRFFFFLAVPEFELRALRLLGRNSTTWAKSYSVLTMFFLCVSRIE
jgi:hypothetical protein